jgi:hypothetical protein
MQAWLCAELQAKALVCCPAACGAGAAGGACRRAGPHVQGLDSLGP